MTTFQLKIQQVEKICLFELSWGKGQQLTARLPYPMMAVSLYEEWQRAYLSYYNKALRGRVAEIGSLTTPSLDWHGKLYQGEAKLLSEFHNWLRSAELYKIRVAIATAIREDDKEEIFPRDVDIFLTCSSLELERLPWEAWEIVTEFALTPEKIRIARSPSNIRTSPNIPNINGKPRKPRRKARILAVLGDDTGLNFQAEKDAMGSISRLAEIEFVGWQPEKNIIELKDEIKQALESDLGWDILFFAGHSNETSITGGEIAIAPM